MYKNISYIEGMIQKQKDIIIQKEIFGIYEHHKYEKIKDIAYLDGLEDVYKIIIKGDRNYD